MDRELAGALTLLSSKEWAPTKANPSIQYQAVNQKWKLTVLFETKKQLDNDYYYVGYSSEYFSCAINFAVIIGPTNEDVLGVRFSIRSFKLSCNLHVSLSTCFKK